MKIARFLLILIISFFVLTNRLEARYYDSKTGRFLSEDPIGFEGGDVNLYTYTGNNPVNYTDPYGLFIQGAIPYTCAINPALCAGVGAISIGVGIYYYYNPPIPFALPNQPEQCKDDKSECEKLYRIDTETCNAITRRRGANAGAKCHASASQRYSECLRYGIGGVRTPLNTWDN